MVGRRLGRFTIRALLGQGGMASVWRARDELSGRDVAVKVLAEALATSPDACRRFRREAEIAALLDHPSIAPVYDTGEQDGCVYLAMAMIDGKTLAERLTQGLPPLASALRTLALAAEALGYAHGRGVLHRDVSSRNIMLGDDGRVFVLDFGLALVYGRSRLSSSGARLGTIAFMSPEVMRGEEADPRSDLYGLGVTAYHYLTGNFPFTGEHDEAVVYQRLNLPIVPPSALRSEIGADLDGVITRALARDAAERWPSADEMAAALNRAGAATGGHNGSDGPRETSPVDATSRRTADRGAGLASRFAAGSATIYLAIAPFAASGDTEASTRTATNVATGLTETLTAGLARMDRVHTVALPVPAGSSGDPDAFARTAGANLALHGSVRAVGTVLRVTFSLLDPESGDRIAGGTADGSATAPFELEDRLVDAVRGALGPAGADGPPTWRQPLPDPAGAERYALALSYLHRSDNEASLDGAIALLEGLLASEGESARIHATLGRAFVEKFLLTRVRAWEVRAAAAVERARSLDVNAPEVMLVTGELHCAAGRHAEAEAELKGLLALQPHSVEGRLTLAITADRLGRPSESEEICQRLIAENPRDWRGYRALGLLLFRHGRYAQATGPWRRVTELVPDNANAHSNLGSALFRMGRLEDAIATFELSNEIRPSALAYFNLGTALYHLERYDECVDAFEKAVAINPSDPLTWGNLGSACRFIPGHDARMRVALERGIAMLQEQIEREPADGETWARLASWHANLGQRAQASRAIRRAMEMSPDDVNCMVSAASTHLDLDDRTAALYWLDRAVRGGYAVDSLGRKTAFRTLEGDPEFDRILARGSREAGAWTGHITKGGPPS